MDRERNHFQHSPSKETGNKAQLSHKRRQNGARLNEEGKGSKREFP